MSVFRGFFLWLEEHQIGILATIAAHLLVVTVILILKINFQAKQEYVAVIDLSRIETKPEETPEEKSQQAPQQQSAQEFVQEMRKEYNVRSTPVNVADERAAEKIDKMVRDIKAEANITDPKPQQEQAAEEPPKSEKVMENEERVFDNKFPVNAAGERTVYKGPTTVSYELSNRRHTWMPAPVYKCRSGGKIVVDIVVSGNGYVLTAEVNSSKSSSGDPCLVESAKRDAERSRFNESSQAKQQGSITYIFQPQ